MTQRASKMWKRAGFIVVGLCIVAGAAAAMPHVKDWIKPSQGESADNAIKSNSIALDKDHPDTIRFMDPNAAKELHVQSGLVTKARPRFLTMDGSLGPDTDHFLPVRARFPGEVMELGKIRVAGPEGSTERDIGNGDLVKKDTLLAVVWSKDFGLAKTALLTAVSNLLPDEDILNRFNELYGKGSITERQVRDQERMVNQDRLALNAAELTLRSWRLSEQEVKALYDEAVAAVKLKMQAKVDPKSIKWQEWARVEVRAPFDGTILEKNLAIGAIVDTTTNLFILGDLSHLTVWANAHEEDLPILQSLPQPIAWKIRLKNDSKAPAMSGTIQEIRPIIDPMQHTALVKGRVPNNDKKLVIAQFITASVEVPPAPDTVEIPTTALVEDGQESIVFVQPNEYEPRFSLRRVVVARRGRDSAVLRSSLTPAEEKRGLAALHVGERVVTNGALEILGALRDLQDANKPASPNK